MTSIGLTIAQKADEAAAWYVFYFSILNNSSDTMRQVSLPARKSLFHLMVGLMLILRPIGDGRVQVPYGELPQYVRLSTPLPVHWLNHLY